MKKLAVMLLSFVLIFAGPVAAKNIEIEGQVNQKVNYLNQEELIEGITELNLEIEKEFGFDKKIYLNPVFKFSYNQDSDFSRLDLNKKNGEDGEYDILKEAYFDLYLKDADVRVGKQIVSWGSAFKLNPTDVVNPIDYTAEDPTEAELSVPAVKTDYYFNYNTLLSGIMIGQHRPSPVPNNVENKINETGSEMIGEGLTEDITSTLINKYHREPLEAKQTAKTITTNIMNKNFTVNRAEKKDIENLSDVEIALKFIRRNIKGYDISLSYFKGYGDIPLITSDYKQIEKKLKEIAGTYINQQLQPSTEKVPLKFGYKKTQSLGLSGRGSIGDIGVWSELNYSQNEDEEKKVDIVLGGDYTFENNFYTIVQLFHRSYKDYKINSILENNGKERLLKDQNYLLLHGELPFRQIHTLKTDIIYNIEKKNYILKPHVNLSLSNNIDFNIGTVVINEDKTNNDLSLFTLGGEKKTYLELTYSF